MERTITLPDKQGQTIATMPKRNGCHLPSRPLEELEGTAKMNQNTPLLPLHVPYALRETHNPHDIKICSNLRATHSPHDMQMLTTRKRFPTAIPSTDHAPL